VPAATASKHDATRRASNGVTKPVKSAARTVELMEFLARSPGMHSFREIREVLGHPKSSLHAHAAASLLSQIDLLEEEIRVAEDMVAAHLVSVPGAWGVDAGGATGPGAGLDGDAAVLPAADRLDEISGMGRQAAAALIAEIGLDMSRFPTPEALVSWAGLTPTARQSGPCKGRGKKGHGNTYAKGICVLAACAAANTDTFLEERFRRLASRPGGGGRKKAGCAVGRSILAIVWHLLNDPAARYRDLGPDWHARHTDRSRKARNAQRQLEALGFDVVITLREDAA
jgi:transposase